MSVIETTANLSLDEHNGSIIYTTGITENGIRLVGGIWKLWDQDGFPVEMSYLTCRDNGWMVDWLEAMADASISNNCPALMEKMEGFLGPEDIAMLKHGFMQMLKSGKTYEQIIAEKRANGSAISAFFRRGKANDPSTK